MRRWVSARARVCVGGGFWARVLVTWGGRTPPPPSRLRPAAFPRARRHPTSPPRVVTPTPTLPGALVQVFNTRKTSPVFTAGGEPDVPPVYVDRFGCKAWTSHVGGQDNKVEHALIFQQVRLAVGGPGVAAAVVRGGGGRGGGG